MEILVLKSSNFNSTEQLVLLGLAINKIEYKSSSGPLLPDPEAFLLNLMLEWIGLNAY